MLIKLPKRKSSDTMPLKYGGLTRAQARSLAFTEGTYADQIKFTTALTMCSKCGSIEKFDPWTPPFCERDGNSLEFGLPLTRRKEITLGDLHEKWDGVKAMWGRFKTQTYSYESQSRNDYLTKIDKKIAAVDRELGVFGKRKSESRLLKIEGKERLLLVHIAIANGAVSKAIDEEETNQRVALAILERN